MRNTKFIPDYLNEISVELQKLNEGLKGINEALAVFSTVKPNAYADDKETAPEEAGARKKLEYRDASAEEAGVQQHGLEETAGFVPETASPVRELLEGGEGCPGGGRAPQEEPVPERGNQLDALDGAGESAEPMQKMSLGDTRPTKREQNLRDGAQGTGRSAKSNGRKK